MFKNIKQLVNIAETDRKPILLYNTDTFIEGTSIASETGHI